MLEGLSISDLTCNWTCQWQQRDAWVMLCSHNNWYQFHTEDLYHGKCGNHSHQKLDLHWIRYYILHLCWIFPFQPWMKNKEIFDYLNMLLLKKGKDLNKIVQCMRIFMKKNECFYLQRFCWKVNFFYRKYWMQVKAPLNALSAMGINFLNKTIKGKSIWTC